MIRVFPDFHEKRPGDFAEVVRGEEQFMTFVLLDLAVKEGLLTLVGHEEIPESKRAFPIFRSSGGMKKNEVTKNWWLWDGEKGWYVGELTEAQQHFPIRGIGNPAMIVDKLCMGWRAEMFP